MCVWKGTGWSCLAVCLDMVTVFFYGLSVGSMNHDSYTVEMIQSLEVTAERHNRLPLISVPCGLNVFCTEDSIPSCPVTSYLFDFCYISKGLHDPAEPNDSCKHSLF